MKRLIVLVLLLSAAAWADTETLSTSNADVDSFLFFTDLIAAPFDPALGTLNSVFVDWTMSFQSWQTTFEDILDPNGITLSGTISSELTGDIDGISDTAATSPQPFTLTTPQLGCGGFTWECPSSGFGGITLSASGTIPQADDAGFIIGHPGPATNVVAFSHHAILSSSQDISNLEVTTAENVIFRGTIAVTYDYTPASQVPEPKTAFFIALIMLPVIWLRHRKVFSRGTGIKA